MPQGHLATHKPFLMAATACWEEDEKEEEEEWCVCVCVSGTFSEERPGRLLNTL